MALLPAQLDVLRRAIDRIVPADDYPAASEAGVLDFLERLFVADKDLERIYGGSLDDLDSAAHRSCGRGFARLDDQEADSLLNNLQEAGALETFFRLLCEQTMEGYYADPGNGGNRDGISWKMVGFEVTA